MASGSNATPDAQAPSVQKPAPAPVAQNDPSPSASSTKAPSTTPAPTQPAATSSTTAAPTQPTTLASAQPAPADPAPADTPDVSKDDKTKAAPEMKKASYDPKTYIIGEQDQLSIDVWREKEISTTAVVRPDGKITIPLVDEVYVVGLTPLQLQSLLEEKLKPFLTVPQVTVIVKEISSRRVYLMGQGGKNGPFLINSTTTVLQLIAQAGGLGPFAKRKKIDIMRQVNGETKHFRFNYDEVIKGKHLEQNIVLQPGDIIVVP
jgi:polysaccharide export outer membrane protein